MEERTLGRTGRTVSVVGLGTWQLGADWGDVSEADALAVLEAAAEEGVTFFDTADVYGDGRSETVIGRFLADNPGSDITVATKMGRRVDQVPENYVLDNFREWTDRSRRNLGVERLDLVQLHCPPTAVYDDDALYDALDTLVEEGRIAAYGVSVEKVEEALAAIRRPHVATVQIIANAFRLKPLEEVFPKAAAVGVGIIVRVPLASGLLSGKYDENTSFAADDHRAFNRDGSAFDVGETFSGRRLRDRPAGRPRVRQAGLGAGTRRRDQCAGGHRVAVAARGGLERHPGRPQRRAGAGQRRGGSRRASRGRVRRGREAHLRRAAPRPDPPPLVTEDHTTIVGPFQ